MSRTRGRPGASWLRRWHRWLGLGSLVFVVLLSVTGIALNHSDDLGLDRRFVRAGWLLSWYGMEAPPVTSSHAVAEHRVTLLGARLYFDQRELAQGVAGLVGAVSVPPFLVIALDDALLLLTTAGAVVERIPLAGTLPGGAQAAGTAAGALIVRSEGKLYRADEEYLGFDPCRDVSEADVAWSEPSAVPPDGLAALRTAYRGGGVSLERLLADLHSGRLFTAAGPLIMDAVGAMLIVLSVLGTLLWLRGGTRNGGERRSRSGRSGGRKA